MSLIIHDAGHRPHFGADVFFRAYVSAALVELGVTERCRGMINIQTKKSPRR